MEATIKFSPAIPIPVPFYVQKRIQELRSYLHSNNPNYQPEIQHINIKAAIKLYEEGKIDGMDQVFIRDGKIVSREEALEGPSPFICEGRSYQLGEKQAYGHGPFNTNFHEVSISFSIICFQKGALFKFLFQDSYATQADTCLWR
jgi:hypothetical protein